MIELIARLPQILWESGIQGRLALLFMLIMGTYAIGFNIINSNRVNKK